MNAAAGYVKKAATGHLEKWRKEIVWSGLNSLFVPQKVLSIHN